MISETVLVVLSGAIQRSVSETGLVVLPSTNQQSVSETGLVVLPSTNQQSVSETGLVVLSRTNQQSVSETGLVVLPSTNQQRARKGVSETTNATLLTDFRVMDFKNTELNPAKHHVVVCTTHSPFSGNVFDKPTVLNTTNASSCLSSDFFNEWD